MRVLITGASGFVGRHLADHARGEGAAVLRAGRTPPSPVDRETGDFFVADLREPGEARGLLEATQPDAIFHLAAEASVGYSWSHPREVVEGNIRATLGLLEAARECGPHVPLLLACSGEEYGPVPSGRLPVDEDQPLRPQNPYAVSKASADLLGGFFADAHGLRIVRTRAFNHIGPGQGPAYVVASLARQIAEAERSRADGSTVVISTGNAEVRRDFTDVRDVVRAYWAALAHADTGVYNVCSSRAVSILEILEGIARHSPLEVVQRTDPERVRPHDVPEVRGSHARLTEATGWTPRIPLDETLGDTLEWWRGQR